MLNLGLLDPPVILDVNRLQELSRVAVTDGVLCIGALTRHYEVLTSPLIRLHCPLLSEAAALIGHPQVRNCGTVGGSVAHADPAAEYPAALAALGAEIIATSVGGERRIPANQFFVTYLTTALEEAELLTEIQIPIPPARSGWSFQELSFREGDFAVVGAASIVTLDEAGVCCDARIALCGVDSMPIRVNRAESMLKGTALADSTLRDASKSAAAEIEPPSDFRASADYRRRMTSVFVHRSLQAAARRAGALVGPLNDGGAFMSP
jgi:CO/xanthine dehydrogenase FAD-binding subunit